MMLASRLTSLFLKRNLDCRASAKIRQLSNN